MPTLQQVRDTVDTKLANFWTNQVVPRQAAYLAAHGEYWQGLAIFNVDNLPDNLDDGSSTVAAIIPILNTHPTDQVETWADLAFNLGVTVPFAASIDVYDGPLGKGYVGTVWVKWNGNFYTRSQNVGPEDYRTRPWQQISRAVALAAIQGFASLPATKPSLWTRMVNTVKGWFGLA
jgi:hypothetical protein